LKILLLVSLEDIEDFIVGLSRRYWRMCEDFIANLFSKILKILLLVSLEDIEECVKILLLI